ncbi:MAG: 50S ribosomal protein L33 [Myxococcota bacterium]
MAARRASSDSQVAPGRIRIALACSVCGARNYKSTKSLREGSPLSLKKFCSHCNQHTVHIEGK